MPEELQKLALKIKSKEATVEETEEFFRLINKYLGEAVNLLEQSQHQ